MKDFDQSVARAQNLLKKKIGEKRLVRILIILGICLIWFYSWTIFQAEPSTVFERMCTHQSDLLAQTLRSYEVFVSFMFILIKL